MARKKNLFLKDEYTILVVDDQSEVLETVIPILEREGYRVLGAQSGMEALEMLKVESVDLMLLDYFMPGMNGEEVVREIRNFDKEMFILLQTGYAGEKPPLEMLKYLNIQGYHDKTEGPDKLLLWVAAGIRSCAQMRSNKHMREGLTCILHSVPHIFRVQAFVELLKDTLEYLTGLVKFENGFIIIEKYNDNENLAYGKGIFKGLSYEQIMQSSLCFGVIETVRETKDVVQSEGVIVLPILDDDNWRGMVYIQGCSIENDECMDLVKIYINQAVEAVINIQLHEEVIISNKKLKDSYSQLERTYYELIEAFTKAVDAKDKYTAGHSTRVSIYSRVIGKALGMSKEELNKLKVISLFHDMGKIGIQDAVLLKEGRLTEEEFQVIKQHPIIGSEILSPVSMLEDIIIGVKHHHEKYDGKGYPDGLAGENIPLNARILAVADSFDAMTSDRSYQKRRSFEEGLAELERCAGTQFDPELVRIFVTEFRNNMKYFKRLILFWDNYHHFNHFRPERVKNQMREGFAEEYAAAAKES